MDQQLLQRQGRSLRSCRALRQKRLSFFPWPGAGVAPQPVRRQRRPKPGCHTRSDWLRKVFCRSQLLIEASAGRPAAIMWPDARHHGYSSWGRPPELIQLGAGLNEVAPVGRPGIMVRTKWCSRWPLLCLAVNPESKILYRQNVGGMAS